MGRCVSTLSNTVALLNPRGRWFASYLPYFISATNVFFLCTSFWIAYFFPEQKILAYISLAIVYLLAGTPALIEAINQLFALQVDLDILMTLAAYGSIWISEGFEGGLLLTLFQLSKTLEEDATSKARAHLEDLEKLTPQYAYMRNSGKNAWDKVSITQVPLGAQVRISSGEIIPVDGKVLEGQSEVALKQLTGESIPKMVSPGDQVHAGSQNMLGTLVVESQALASENTLAKIIELISQAQEAKPKLQRWFDRFSGTYAQLVITITALSIFTLYALLSMPLFGSYGALYRSLSFLIAASPCALIIALPVTYLSALSSCARRGILLKGTQLFEVLSKINLFAFDKTGTLTQAQLEILFSQTLPIASDQEQLTEEERLLHFHLLYLMQERTQHPIAQSLLDFIDTSFPEHQREVQVRYGIKEFQTLPGKGLSAIFECPTKPSLERQEETEITCIAGQPDWINSYINLPKQFLDEIAKRRSTPVRFIVFASPFASTLFTLGDIKRPEASYTIASLKDLDIQTCILTGDRAAAAQPLARELGIDQLYAHLSPKEKLRHIESLCKSHLCAMVGDGINDAPALARAHVGIAMAEIGSGAATYAADVLLLQDRLSDLPWLIQLARKTQHIASQNLIFALTALIVASTLALLGYIPMWASVIAHEGGTILVALNGLRMLRFRILATPLF